MNHEIKDFETDVIERSKQIPVVVDFWAEWCGPCRILGPVLERLAGQSDGRWVLAKVDTETHQEPAIRYGVRSIPNVKLFVDGRVVDEFVGALPEFAVKQWLQKALPDPASKELDQAEELLGRGDETGAREILSRIRSAQPDNVKARVLLARTELATDPARAAELVRDIEEDSEHFATVETIRTIAHVHAISQGAAPLAEDPVKAEYLTACKRLLERDYDSALTGFIRIIRENRYYDDDGARKACIAVFRILGDDHDTTRKYRREFGSALNA